MPDAPPQRADDSGPQPSSSRPSSSGADGSKGAAAAGEAQGGAAAAPAAKAGRRHGVKRSGAGLVVDTDLQIRCDYHLRVWTWGGGAVGLHGVR